MKWTNIIVTAVVAGLVAGVVAGLVGGNQPVVQDIGTRFPNGISVDGTAPSAGEIRGTTLTVGELTQGGGVNEVTPTSAAVTLTEADLLNYNVITFTASTTQAALTATLPATSTMTSLLPNAGDYRTWVIENPFTAAATTTTIGAGTGIDLQEPDGQNVVIGINNYAWLTCFREASTDVVCRVDESIPAD